ncbi:MAG: hypothetical protein CEN90_561 [Parcubacteria group bacterium Licking1014_17]|nr:MAG: hypothetical protein CEN90_561 [Parcubacteria group bacterium Licking1014_17]
MPVYAGRRVFDASPFKIYAKKEETMFLNEYLDIEYYRQSYGVDLFSEGERNTPTIGVKIDSRHVYRLSVGLKRFGEEHKKNSNWSMNSIDEKNERRLLVRAALPDVNELGDGCAECDGTGEDEDGAACRFCEGMGCEHFVNYAIAHQFFESLGKLFNLCNRWQDHYDFFVLEPKKQLIVVKLWFAATDVVGGSRVYSIGGYLSSMLEEWIFSKVDEKNFADKVSRTMGDIHYHICQQRINCSLFIDGKDRSWQMTCGDHALIHYNAIFPGSDLKRSNLLRSHNIENPVHALTLFGGIAALCSLARAEGVGC